MIGLNVDDGGPVRLSSLENGKQKDVVAIRPFESDCLAGLIWRLAIDAHWGSDHIIFVMAGTSILT